MGQLFIPCPQCGHLLHLPDSSFLGRKGRCPECRLKFILDEQLAIDESEAGRSTEDELDDQDLALTGADTSVPPTAIVSGEPTEFVSGATDCDERAARWVLQIGGILKICTGESQLILVNGVDSLPGTPFRVIDVILQNNKEVDDAGMQYFSSLDALLTLRLSETNITDEGISYLNGLTSLSVLNLSYTKVTDGGLKYLVGLKGLQQLDLANTAITDAGLTHVRKLTSLEFLGLYATAVTNAGLRQLTKLKKLKFLGLYKTPVTNVGVNKLKKSLPDCKINR